MSMSTYFYTDTGNLEIIHTPQAAQAPARVYPWHIHLYHWTAGHVISGAVQLTVDGAVRHYQAKDFFLIPPETPHHLIVGPGSGLLVLSYNNPPELADLASLFLASANDSSSFAANDELRALALFALSACDVRQLTDEAHQADMMAKVVASMAARIVATPQMEFPLAGC